MFERIRAKAQKVKARAKEHPIFTGIAVVVGVVVTGGVVFMVTRNLNGEEELVPMSDLNLTQGNDNERGLRIPNVDKAEPPVEPEVIVEPVQEPVVEPELVVDPVQEPVVEPVNDEGESPYWLSSRRGHLRDITPRFHSLEAEEKAERIGFKLGEHQTYVKPSTPHIRCSADDPRAILPISWQDDEEKEIVV